MHSVHFHGQILTVQNHHTDMVSLFPASSFTAEMVADNPGHWLLTCTVNDHLMGELLKPQILNMIISQTLGCGVLWMIVLFVQYCLCFVVLSSWNAGYI